MSRAFEPDRLRLLTLFVLRSSSRHWRAPWYLRPWIPRAVAVLRDAARSSDVSWVVRRPAGGGDDEVDITFKTRAGGWAGFGTAPQFMQGPQLVCAMPSLNLETNARCQMDAGTTHSSTPNLTAKVTIVTARSYTSSVLNAEVTARVLAKDLGFFAGSRRCVFAVGQFDFARNLAQYHGPAGRGALSLDPYAAAPTPAPATSAPQTPEPQSQTSTPATPSPVEATAAPSSSPSTAPTPAPEAGTDSPRTPVPTTASPARPTTTPAPTASVPAATQAPTVAPATPAGNHTIVVTSPERTFLSDKLKVSWVVRRPAGGGDGEVDITFKTRAGGWAGFGTAPQFMQGPQLVCAMPSLNLETSARCQMYAGTTHSSVPNVTVNVTMVSARTSATDAGHAEVTARVLAKDLGFFAGSRRCLFAIGRFDFARNLAQYHGPAGRGALSLDPYAAAPTPGPETEAPGASTPTNSPPAPATPAPAPPVTRAPSTPTPATPAPYVPGRITAVLRIAGDFFGPLLATATSRATLTAALLVDLATLMGVPQTALSITDLRLESLIVQFDLAPEYGIMLSSVATTNTSSPLVPVDAESPTGAPASPGSPAGPSPSPAGGSGFNASWLVETSRLYSTAAPPSAPPLALSHLRPTSTSAPPPSSGASGCGTMCLAGIAVGAVCLVVALAAVAALVVVWRHRNAEHEKELAAWGHGRQKAQDAHGAAAPTQPSFPPKGHAGHVYHVGDHEAAGGSAADHHVADAHSFSGVVPFEHSDGDAQPHPYVAEGQPQYSEGWYRHEGRSEDAHNPSHSWCHAAPIPPTSDRYHGSQYPRGAGEDCGRQPDAQYGDHADVAQGHGVACEMRVEHHA